MARHADSIGTRTCRLVHSQGRPRALPVLVVVLGLGGGTAHAAAQASWRGLVALLHEYPLQVGRRGSHFSGPSSGGVGGRPVDRRRDLEFAPVEQPEAADLLAGLARAVDESDAVLAALDPAALESRVTIQGVDVTRMGRSTTSWSTSRCTQARSSGSRRRAGGASLGSTPSRKARLAPPGPAPTRARRPRMTNRRDYEIEC